MVRTLDNKPYNQITTKSRIATESTTNFIIFMKKRRFRNLIKYSYYGQFITEWQKVVVKAPDSTDRTKKLHGKYTSSECES